MQQYNIEYFRHWAVDKGGECLSTQYANVRTKLKFRCKSGHEWSAQPRKILEGSWCRECVFDRLRKYTVDHDFFSQDTKESFYWAGFLAADGCVGKWSGAHKVQLHLAIKDFDHLYKFRKTIKSNKPFRFRQRKSPGSDTMCYSHEIRITSPRMFNDLKRFNIVERKTYIYTMPEWIKDHPYVHHFMRGYIDGDGCFTLAQNKGQDPHVLFCMRGTYQFLQSFHDVLVNNGVVKENAYGHRLKIRPKDGKKYPAFDRLTYSGNTVISKMYDFLYKDATVCLERKKEVASNAKKYAVYGNGKRKKKRKESSLKLTKEELLSLVGQFKTQRAVATHLECTAANISWWVKELGISKEEMCTVTGKS